MKSGLLLFQSIASSTLRRIRPPLPPPYPNPPSQSAHRHSLASAAIGMLCLTTLAGCQDVPFPEESLRHDSYAGVTLDLSQLPPPSPDQFHRDLQLAIPTWHSNQRRGIWLRIPTALSDLIPPAVSLGFEFRHAEPGYCVLAKWLPGDGEESRLPLGPSHQVGVGVFVVHPETGKMLVVKEKRGPAAKMKLWKMPTGIADPGEDIPAAAIRELKEETGLDATFQRIICFRQAHGGLFNRSDLFFVCLCTLLEGGNMEAVPQEEEIECVDWIEIEEYANQEVWRESPLYGEMNGAMMRAVGRVVDGGGVGGGVDSVNGEVDGFVGKELDVGFRRGKQTIYVSSKPGKTNDLRQQ